MIIQQAIKKGSKLLSSRKIKTKVLDSELILSNLLNIKREQLLLSEHHKLDDYLYNRFISLIKKRSKSLPVSYIINKKEFWSLDFEVDKYTLIPRPETELMVEGLAKHGKRQAKILDIGTGSGCIIISLLKELKLATGIGIDICPKAISVAKRNARAHKITNRIKFFRSSLETIFFKNFDIVVSNPPYIPNWQMKNLVDDVKLFEPKLALRGGIDGLDLIRKIIYKSKILLKKKGLLALEINNNQYNGVKTILESSGYRVIEKIEDFKNNIRCIISTKL